MSATIGGGAEHRAGDGEPHHAYAAQADEQERAALRPPGVAFERRIRREPRAHQRSGEVGRKRRVVEQITRMRNQNVGGEPAVGSDAQMAVSGAKIFFAA